MWNDVKCAAKNAWLFKFKVTTYPVKPPASHNRSHLLCNVVLLRHIENLAAPRHIFVHRITLIFLQPKDIKTLNQYRPWH